ncbi:hypothetical protein HAX54_042307 [Datura stramonium]|uniref:Uncharacterized protein n=1 Tax=Datura stramonium TaxID=4076 RepID=A0ABS8W2Y9_DATST|nr:hypothetical protein [Datura stramonium]
MDWGGESATPAHLGFCVFLGKLWLIVKRNNMQCRDLIKDAECSFLPLTFSGRIQLQVRVGTRGLRNHEAFANIWSDFVFGVSLFILLYFNESKVKLLKFTGYKILNNFSDTGKGISDYSDY